VRDVGVCDLVGDLLAAPGATNDVGTPQDSEVLGDQGLRHVQTLDELVDAEWAFGVQGDDDGDTHRGREGLEQGTACFDGRPV
jgi:hypothetical protein